MRRLVAIVAAGGAMLMFGLLVAFANQSDRSGSGETLGPASISPPAAVTDLRQLPGSDTSTPTTPSPGQIAIVLAKSAYASAEPISATVADGLDRTIYAQDQKTDCEIAFLEQWNGTSWQPIKGCGLRRLAQVVPIAPSASESVEIDPSSAHLAGAQPRIDPGVYRLRFPYSLDPNTDPGSPEPENVHSVLFSITASQPSGQSSQGTVDPASLAPSGGIAVEATRGPTCAGPGRPGQVCEEPAQVIVDVRDQAGQVVAHLQTDATGRSLAQLPPGTYSVEATRLGGAQSGGEFEVLSVSPQQVTITSGAVERVQVSIDTGIR